MFGVLLSEEHAARTRRHVSAALFRHSVRRLILLAELGVHERREAARVAATVKEEERAGVGGDEGEGPRAVMATMAAMAGERRAQREERISKQRQPWARARGGEEPRREELDEVGFPGAKKGRCAARNAPTKWTAGNEISFFQRS